MMIFPKHSLSLALLMLGAFPSTASGEEQCVSPPSVTCSRTTTPPTLDGDLGDWSDVTGGIETPITAALGATPYEPGNLGIRCTYDETRIYFAFEVPGSYRFDSEDNHKAASISTMMKMGADATYFMMGGCPHAMNGECDTTPGVVPDKCTDYLVDIGGHWELRTTEMGTAYPINVADGTGDDAVANKDDEFAVSPYCRFDDAGPDAGNEWAGAWSHTVPSSPEVTKRSSPTTATSTIGTDGTYVFEMSRLLQTESTATDAQLEAGETYGFGVAYWDPNENEETGWTDAGHFVTGCSKDWIDLVLDDGDGTGTNNDEKATTSGASGAFAAVAILAAGCASAVASLLM